jgi:hypothetical protein
MVFCSEGWGPGSTNDDLYPITLTHEQSQVIRQARKAGLVRTDKEAVEIGLATLRPQLQQQRDQLAAAAEEEERKLAANQFSLFPDAAPDQESQSA